MMMRMLAAGLFIAALGFQPVLAQEVPSSKDYGKVSSGVYALDKSHASVVFKINHMGFSLYQGRFNNLDAKLNFDSKVPEKSVIEATIDVNSIDTNNAKLQEELKGEKFFNAAKYPNITFKSLHTTRTGDVGTMIGELTMMGITKPVTLNVTFHGAGQHPFTKKDALGFSATGSINRSQWGMSNFIPMVGDEVQFEIQTEFQYAGGSAMTAPAPAASPAPAPAPSPPVQAAVPVPAPVTPKAEPAKTASAPAPVAAPAVAPAAPQAAPQAAPSPVPSFLKFDLPKAAAPAPAPVDNSKKK